MKLFNTFKINSYKMGLSHYHVIDTMCNHHETFNLLIYIAIHNSSFELNESIPYHNNALTKICPNITLFNPKVIFVVLRCRVVVYYTPFLMTQIVRVLLCKTVSSMSSQRNKTFGQVQVNSFIYLLP